MPSFSIPLSGLEADSTALNTIANNLSNMNTTAYKAQTVNFSDLFYQQIGASGSGDPEQVGAGTHVGSISTDFTTGSPNTTGNSTNVALNGDGFFAVQQNGETELTRDGTFSLDLNGNLQTQSGQQVMGYAATNGVVNTNAPLSGIQVPVGQVEKPQATANMSITANLDATAAVGTTVPAQVKVYDSLGVAHEATVTFTKPAAPANTWNYSIALPAGDATPGANTTGTLTFDTTGKLIAPASNPAATTFTGLSDGASNMSFAFDLYGSNNQPSITQVAGASAVASTNQDGFTSGQYQSVSIGSDGTISAKFSNNHTQVVGQLAVAMVTNEQGLDKLGDGNYAATLVSGDASYGVAGTAGRGSMQGGALEASNVDISTQFSDLIVAQRAFEANSKAVTTFDTVSQDTINMVH
ncbi:MAG: flagellar hook protein FlgE [Acidobacteria bacterium]|nr:flagellar hook protein FlgE [Acidobacteriota bacterium]